MGKIAKSSLDSSLDKAIDAYVSKLKVNRRSIGLYSKLNVTFAIIGDKDKPVFRFLTQGKYTFSKGDTKVKGIYSYSVDVDSIEEACTLKKKIDAINKKKQKPKPKTKHK